VDIGEVNAVAVGQKTDDPPGVRPVRAEELTLVGLALFKDFRREVGGLVEVGAGEVEEEGAGDHGHLERPECLICMNHPRNRVPEDPAYFLEL
jgi:hypothetical protein